MKSLQIKNFKCFEDERIYFSNLTVLAGNNGAGKSTVIQSLLILLQSFNKKESMIIPSKYYINDYYCELGSSKRLLYKDANKDFIEFIFYGEEDSFTSFKLIEDQTDRGVFNLLDNPDDLTINKSLNFLKYLDFIGADRFGPKTFHHTDSNFSRINVGKYGEYSTLVFDMYKDEFFNAGLPHDEIRVGTLRTHVDRWLTKIFGFVQIDTEFIEEANVAILKIKNHPDRDYESPVNMPYGISYALPIIVSCLVRLIPKEKLFNDYHNDDDAMMIIVENPEAHLHPYAQSMMGFFLAYMSDRIQIIVETHSDHVINGMRKAIRHEKISNDNIVFNFFKADEVSSKVNLIEIDKEGELREWPKGFFDQFEKDMMELL
jgi:predicted ATPase